MIVVQAGAAVVGKPKVSLRAALRSRLGGHKKTRRAAGEVRGDRAVVWSPGCGHTSYSGDDVDGDDVADVETLKQSTDDTRGKPQVTLSFEFVAGQLRHVAA